MSNFDPEKIPIWLRRTPEQLAQDRAYQDQLRQAQGPGRRANPLEQRLIRAAAIKRSTTAQLEHLRRRRNPNPLHIETAQAQLAEALAMEGNYADAAALHPDPPHAERFQMIAEAIERDDEAHCECPIEQKIDPGTNQPVMMAPNRIDEFVVSHKHNRRLMPLVICQCGDANVKAAPTHLQDRLRRIGEKFREAKERTKEKRK